MYWFFPPPTKQGYTLYILIVYVIWTCDLVDKNYTHVECMNEYYLHVRKNQELFQYNFFFK